VRAGPTGSCCMVLFYARLGFQAWCCGLLRGALLAIHGGVLDGAPGGVLTTQPHRRLLGCFCGVGWWRCLILRGFGTASQIHGRKMRLFFISKALVFRREGLVLFTILLLPGYCRVGGVGGIPWHGPPKCLSCGI
jgi:hypothetical protein